MSLREKIETAMRATGICGARGSEYRVLADAAMRALRPHDAIADSAPVILYFPTKEHREDFIAAVHEAMPGMMIPVRIE